MATTPPAAPSALTKILAKLRASAQASGTIAAFTLRNGLTVAVLAQPDKLLPHLTRWNLLLRRVGVNPAPAEIETVLNHWPGANGEVERPPVVFECLWPLPPKHTIKLEWYTEQTDVKAPQPA